MKEKSWILRIASLFMLSAVILGAMGAHALESELSADQLDSFQTGVRYQLIHGLALLSLPLLDKVFNMKWINLIGILMSLGIVFFSFSIYLLSTRSILGLEESVSFLGPITPIGGILLIFSWAILFLSTFFKR